MNGNTIRRREADGRKLLGGEPLDTFPEGRVCAADDCSTKLSQYNPSPLCGEHNGWREAPVRRRRRSSAV